MVKLSIIIPVWNEDKVIAKTLEFVLKHTSQSEIIVVDGDSTDATPEICRQFSKVQFIESTKRGRAAQMNLGATHSKAEILYFLHADSQPPADFEDLILEAVKKGSCSGCFRFKFDSPKWMLKINSFFTRFPYLWCRGGDQSLFITRSLFQELKGYDERFEVMEEYDLIRRIQTKQDFCILPFSVLVSARKYDTNSWFRVMWANFIAFRSFKRGEDTSRIKKRYKANLHPYL